MYFAYAKNQSMYKVCNLYTFQMQAKDVQLSACKMLTCKIQAMDHICSVGIFCIHVKHNQLIAYNLQVKCIHAKHMQTVIFTGFVFCMHTKHVQLTALILQVKSTHTKCM